MQNDANVLPVSGGDAIEILKNDHTVINSLLRELVEGSADRQSATLEKLKAALTIHNATEENLVYPALREVAGKKAESQHLYNETAEADVVVFQLDTMLKTGETGKAAKLAEKLQAAVLEHIDDEEGKAFPHLQDNATPQQARMLTDAVRQFRDTLQMKSPGAAQSRVETGEIGGTRARQ